MSWVERAVDRSPMVQRSRTRGMEQAQVIVQSARRLIAVKGSAFTTQELVKDAGVALQTFYRYFASKDQLLLAVFEDLISEFCVALREQVAGVNDPVERLRLCVTVAGASADRCRGECRRPAIHHERTLAAAADVSRGDRGRHCPLPRPDCRRDRGGGARGSLQTPDPRGDAWHITQLVMAVFHHYAFRSPESPRTKWQTGFGASVSSDWARLNETTPASSSAPVSIPDSLAGGPLAGVVERRTRPQFSGYPCPLGDPGPRHVEGFDRTREFRIECDGDLPAGLPAALCVKGYFTDCSDTALQSRAAGEPEANFYGESAEGLGVRTLPCFYRGG